MAHTKLFNNIPLEGSPWKESIFYDSRSIPFAIAFLSLGWQITHAIMSALLSTNRSEQSPGTLKKLKLNVEHLGGYAIFCFMLARLLGSIALFSLSCYTLVNACEVKHFFQCPEHPLTGALLYSMIMGIVALGSKEWNLSATRTNIIILLSIFGVYLYRDIWPLATYTQQPEDIREGNIIWVKFAVLSFTAVIIPLFVPRRYVPVDPENPMSNANAEQMASIFSILTYTFLDEVIFLGYKVPHLRYDQLPPLADYDEAKYQIARSFPHLDVFSGAPSRHLSLRLMRVFWRDFAIMAVALVGLSLAAFVSPIAIYQILKYLETGGEGQHYKPWLWIVSLFLGPMSQCICWQFKIFVGNRLLSMVEIVLTELVFEHSLRIRFKGEIPNKEKSLSVAVSPPSANGHSSSHANGNESPSGHSEASSVTKSTDLDPSSTSENPKLTATLKETVKLKPKATEVQNGERQPKPSGNLVGKINNLVTSDLLSIAALRDFDFLVLGVPLNVTLCLVFLYRLLGWSTFVGLGIMVALLPIPGYVAKKIQHLQNERMKLTDARIQAVSETMSIIRMVKLFGWESRISARLKKKREEELQLIWKIKWLNCISSLIGFIFPTITIVATYGLYTVVMKKELTPSIVFSSMAVFSNLRNQLFRIMQQTVTFLQAKVSLDRLNEFLHRSELLDSFVPQLADTPVPRPFPEVQCCTDIGFRNASFTWSLYEGESGGLRTPSGRMYRLCIEGELLFKRNGINIIIGPTGSGKSSILLALLGEMHFIPTALDSWFNLPRKGGIAYATQESWVQNDTIRNNILFGLEYDGERYQSVVKQCGLQQDLEMFDAGDATEVGERGLTLSGGQKARVTLARAIYSSAEIILLDDVFAALDVHTAAWIVNNCFRGDLIKDRTVLIVTHNVALVSPVADSIVTISTNGKIKNQVNAKQAPDTTSWDTKPGAELRTDKLATKQGEEVIDADLSKRSVRDGKLTIAEEIAEGHVTWKSFKLFLTTLGGDHPVSFFLIVIGALLASGWTLSFQTWYIGYWGSQYESHPASEVPVYLYLSGYSSITIMFCIFFSLSYMVFMYGSVRASRVINTKLIDSILGSTLRWLDKTPVGRIIGRCTQDIRAVDGPIPQALLSVTDLASGVFAKLGAIVIFTPIFIWPGLAIAFVGLWLGNMYLKAQLSVKRETSNARSPLLSHFNAAIQGITSIRAYGAQERFRNDLTGRLNHYTRVSRMTWSLNRWIGVRMDLLGSTFTTSLAAYLVYGPRVGTSNTGFSLSMAVDFTFLILYSVRTYNQFEVQANSLERIQGYLDIEHEASHTKEGQPPASWPTSGDLRVENLCARYSHTGPQILHNLSFHVGSGERVGVVGRTGSGKSSLMLALLRCIITEGQVYFDGILTSAVNLDALRTSIAIIPQIPELLSGTLRENLDPFDQNDDAVLNQSLDAAGLFSLQEGAGEASLSLDSEIASGGGNLSVGQRQIIALARAIIRGSKLLMLDEATSAIDYKTDAVIQHTLRTKLSKDVTVITIAHRLQTIMDSDKILVLDSGRIAEFGRPSELLQHRNGMFRSLVDESGDRERLYELAGMR